MRPLTGEPRKGPGPSRLAYRASRAWKKLWVRRVTLVLIPCAVLALLAWRIGGDDQIHREIAQKRADALASLSKRPEFAMREVRVAGASREVARAVEELVGLRPGMSTLTVDVEEVQARVAALGAVRSARVTMASGGVLEIAIEERIAEALWRDGEDKLWLMDREGAVIVRAVTRAGYPELPVVLGAGAPRAMAEALDLFDADPMLKPRIRALVRIGARRWNIVLDNDLTLMLPEEGASDALARVMGWHLGEDLLDRGVASVDMRLANRPTLRMKEEAFQRHRLLDASRNGEGEDT